MKHRHSEHLSLSPHFFILTLLSMASAISHSLFGVNSSVFDILIPLSVLVVGVRQPSAPAGYYRKPRNEFRRGMARRRRRQVSVTFTFLLFRLTRRTPGDKRKAHLGSLSSPVEGRCGLASATPFLFLLYFFLPVGARAAFVVPMVRAPPVTWGGVGITGVVSGAGFGWNRRCE